MPRVLSSYCHFGQFTTPRDNCLPVRRLILPAACVRLMTRPAPCTVEYNAALEDGESTPSTMTASSPIDPPMKPCCPGNAGVAPLRITSVLRP